MSIFIATCCKDRHLETNIATNSVDVVRGRLDAKPEPLFRHATTSLFLPSLVYDTNGDPTFSNSVFLPYEGELTVASRKLLS